MTVFIRKTAWVWPEVLAVAVLASVLFSCKGPEVFGPEAPFALEAARYRSYHAATVQQELLKEAGLSPYIVSYDAGKGGLWHLLALGSARSLEGIMAKRIDAEDKYGITGAEIINYNKLQEGIVVFDPQTLPPPRLSASPPPAGPALRTLVSLFPCHPAYSFSGTLFLDLENSKQPLPGGNRQPAPDLPAGLKPQDVYAVSRAYAETAYYQLLGGKRFVVNLMLPNGKLVSAEGESLAGTLAKRLSKARRIPVNELEPWPSADKALDAWMLNMGTRKETAKPYMVVCDTAGTWCAYLQTEKGSREDLAYVASLIGKGDGLDGYLTFHNAFNALPLVFEPGDMLQRFSVHENRPSTNNALKAGEHTLAAVFGNAELGPWLLEITSVHNQETAGGNFDRAYAKAKNTVLADINGLHAHVVSTQRRDNASKKNIQFPEELAFLAEGYLVVLSNKRTGWHDQTGLAARARALQLFNGFKNDKSFLFF